MDPLGIPTGSPPGSLSPGHQNVPACVRVCLGFVTNQTHCSSVGWVRVAPHSVQLCLHTELGCFGWPRDGCLHAHACHFFLQHSTEPTLHRAVRVYLLPHISEAAVLPLSLPDASSSWGNLGTAPLHHTPYSPPCSSASVDVHTLLCFLPNTSLVYSVSDVSATTTPRPAPSPPLE